MITEMQLFDSSEVSDHDCDIKKSFFKKIDIKSDRCSPPMRICKRNDTII